MAYIGAIGQNIERLVSVEIAAVAEAEERLSSIRNNQEKVGTVIHELEVQLHHIERIQGFIDTKIVRIMRELNTIQGHINAYHKQLSGLHKDLKLRQRTGDNTIGAQIHRYAEIIRSLDAVVIRIKSIKKNIVSSVKRDMSTLRYIAQEAERGL